MHAGRGGGSAPTAAGVVATLSAATLLQWLGASAVLPLLPLYLEQRGTPAAQVGLVMAAYFVGAVAAQYAAGRAGDLVGHRRVLIVGLVAYAVASAAFLLPSSSALTYAVLRAAQGASAGSAEVAALALVARAVAPGARGRAFSAVYGGQLAGIAAGPLVGSAVGTGGMGLLFTGAGVLALVACLPVLAVLPRSPEGGEVAAARSARLTLTGPRGRVLLGVVLVAAASGSLGGVYETVWSLLLDSRGATTAQIGLSWTLFALPFVAVVPLGGWLADRIDRRALVLVGMVVASTLAATYPWLHSVAWLLGLGVLEASGVALGTPAAQSLVADAAPAGASGRAQAVYASANTTAMAGGAAAGGALFGVTPWLPFDLVAALGIVLAGLVGWIWRGMSGRVAARPIDELVPADTTLVEAAGIPAGCAG